ncbi:OmpA family protein [Carboxylicivirga caseinilyticus]|uniref:PorE family type IX secretion system protein n=1 Tax=Carboxylicivirga caseinilyticus TaxID=3417572 RepID=UPI003D32D950|nr:PD40 domain-containing protein [Marinilabiliaceae bacterium A049]
MPFLSNTYRNISFILILFLLFSCSGGKKMGNANKAYLIGEYDRAVKQFKKAYRKEKNRYTKGEISFYLGECYRNTNKYSKAASSYSKSVRYKYENIEAELYLAQCYLASGKVDEAEKAYKSYLDKKALDKRAQNGQASIRLIQSDSIKTRYQVEKVKGLSNTRFSDFSPCYASTEYDQVYFSSMRTEKKSRKRNRITGQGASNIYMARIDAKGKWTDPEPLDETINTEFDEGAGTMSSDGKTMYFTRCPYNNEEPLTAQMFEVSRSGGKWGEPTQITIGGDSILVAHPAVSPDGSTIYFVSDMPGGEGGKDLWKAQKGGESGWEEPVNLGNVINTPGDELYPYVRNDGTLYFASNGHVGYGGLDIYRAVFDEEEGYYKVTNLGRPINSESDDFSIIFKGMEEEGLFSSSRGSSKGVDNIYSFILPKLEFSMRGKVFDQKEETPIGNAYVRLIGTDGTNIKLNVKEDGSFGLQLKKQTDYVFMVASKGFFNYKYKFTTVGLSDNKEFEFEVPMMPMEDAIVFQNIYFQNGKYELNNDSKQELDRLVAILDMNQNIVLDIAAHASGEGDETESIVLSQKRAEAVMNYLLSKGVKTQRLSAKGLGDSQPVKVDAKLAEKYDFLTEGTELTEVNINRIKGSSNKRVAHEINRRIEFKVKKDDDSE